MFPLIQDRVNLFSARFIKQTLYKFKSIKYFITELVLTKKKKSTANAGSQDLTLMKYSKVTVNYNKRSRNVFDN